jgi:hypothetical protein
MNNMLGHYYGPAKYTQRIISVSSKKAYETKNMTIYLANVAPTTRLEAFRFLKCAMKKYIYSGNSM